MELRKCLKIVLCIALAAITSLMTACEQKIQLPKNYNLLNLGPLRRRSKPESGAEGSKTVFYAPLQGATGRQAGATFALVQKGLT